MTRRFIDDDENETFILRDGERLTVPMFMKDGGINPRLNAVQRAIATTQQRDAATFDAASHRPGHRYPSGTNDSLHQPGFRYGVTDTAMEKVYADRDRIMSDSWRDNAGAGTINNAPPTGSYPEGTSHEGSACTVDGAQQTMDAAYAEYDLRIQNSWRTAS
jgi:hypothetical protein